MAGGRVYQDEESGPITDINITPMVDVVRVLLIIFMVTARLINARGVAMDSPQTKAGTPFKSKLEVSIDAAHVLYVNGIAYTDREQMRLKIAALHDEAPELRAVIAADKSVPHGEVMTLIDLVKDAGVTKFSLRSNPLTERGDGAAGSGGGSP